ncbi:MAG TPA: PIN domain-containing protein [Thermoanaerobaculia bacterium]|nr:PIN domain-containing protein [Thermoanaerobaculia bacterium]
MRALFDTSVLVAAVVQAHSMHAKALPWLMRAQDRDLQLVLSAHSLAELYASLTRLPVSPRITPDRASKIIDGVIAAADEIVPLSPEDYTSTIQRISGMGLAGGIVYDALIACAAGKARVERLITFNASHFRRVWPEGEPLLVTPD